MKNPKIYTDAYQLTVMLFGRTKAFSKHLRPNLGREVEKNGLELTMILRKALAAKSQTRLQALNKSSEILDNLKILLQLSFDLKAIHAGGYQEVSELIAEIGRELGGLLKYERQQHHATQQNR